jgi:hypothetical protein
MTPFHPNSANHHHNPGLTPGTASLWHRRLHFAKVWRFYFHIYTLKGEYLNHPTMRENPV